MSTIDSLLPENLLADTAAASAPKKNELGQDEFLKLMLAQMEHQDPFKPMENGEFVAQMAQFSTVAGIESMNASLGTMAEAYGGNQLLQASTLIGRNALVAGNSATLDAESGIDVYYKLPNSTPAVSVDVYSAAGTLVHHAEQSAKAAGTHKLNWDGLLADGTQAPAGPYTLAVTYAENDAFSQAQTLIESTIASVALAPGGNSITLETEEGNTVGLNDIEKLQ